MCLAGIGGVGGAEGSVAALALYLKDDFRVPLQRHEHHAHTLIHHTVNPNHTRKRLAEARHASHSASLALGESRQGHDLPLVMRVYVYVHARVCV